MDNMLVAVFETERQASAAARAMKELSTEGVVLVYASAVIVKGFKRIAIVNFAHDQNSRDPALATATRSLIGLLGHSWQSAEEATAECTTDLMLELANVGVDGGFLDEVSRHLLPGTAAIVSEIDEERLTPIDTLLESQGGIGISLCATRSHGCADSQRVGRFAPRNPHHRGTTITHARSIEGPTASNAEGKKGQVTSDKRPGQISRRVNQA